MKICLINNLYKPLNKGGAERVVDLIAEELGRKKNKVFIISTKPYFWKGKKNESTRYINSFYYNLEKMPKFLRLFWHFIDLLDFWHAFRAFIIIKKEKPDLIISNNLKGISYLLPFFIKFSQVKNIQILHDIQLIHPSGLLIYGSEQKIETIFSKIYQKICKKLFSYCDVVISPSRWLLDLHTGKGFFKNSKKTVLANPVSLGNKLEYKEKINNNFRLLFVGQLEKHKGVEELVKVFISFSDRDKNKFHLSFVGGGTLFGKLENISRKFGNIEVLGKKTSTETLKLMSKHDCLVVPSLCYENSPTVIYEAASMGLPILAARLGGITELVHYLGGVLFCPGSLGDLRKKILFMEKNKNLMQDIAQRSIKKTRPLNIDSYIKKMLSI